jgi:hypothetical protein
MSIFLIYNCAKFHTKILNDCQDIAILLRGAIFFTHPVYTGCAKKKIPLKKSYNSAIYCYF